MRAKEGTDLWLRHRKLELERAVIEAAKACVQSNHPPELQYDRERWDWLVQTVEALREVEEE